jgi:hypothetical protein
MLHLPPFVDRYFSHRLGFLGILYLFTGFPPLLLVSVQ